MSDRPPPLVDSSGVTITQEQVALARARARQRAEKPKPFAPAKPPPGVLPEGEAGRLAMDAVSSFAASYDSWAAESSYTSAWLEGTTFLGYPELSILAQRAEYRVISDTIAGEMTREWIELKANGDEDKTGKIKELSDELDRLQVREAFRKVAEYDGYLGRAHLYIDTGQTVDRKDELKISIGDGGQDSVGWFKAKDLKIKAIRPVEATWAYPTRYESSNPLAGDWYNPETWYVMAQEVHRTRFLTFVGRPVPDMLKPAYSFGGLSLTQMAKPYVDNWLRTRQSVSDLIASFSVSGLKTDMTAVNQLGGQNLFNRLDFFNALRDNHGAMVLNKDTEEWFNVVTPIAGLDSLQAQSQEHMGAVSRIPLVKLLGITPSGLNASSDGEIRSFYDTIHAYQEIFFGPHLTTVIRLVMISLWGEVDEAIVYEFKDLYQQDEGEDAANEKTRTDIDDVNIANGVIKPEEARRRIVKDEKSQYFGLSLDPEDLPEPPAPEGPGLEEPGAETFGEEDGLEEDEAGPEKVEKTEVKFEHPARGEDHCGECRFYLAATTGCLKVRGYVTEVDWCRLFEPAAMNLAGFRRSVGR